MAQENTNYDDVSDQESTVSSVYDDPPLTMPVSPPREFGGETKQGRVSRERDDSKVEVRGGKDRDYVNNGEDNGRNLLNVSILSNDSIDSEFQSRSDRDGRAARMRRLRGKFNDENNNPFALPTTDNTGSSAATNNQASRIPGTNTSAVKLNTSKDATENGSIMNTKFSGATWAPTVNIIGNDNADSSEENIDNDIEDPSIKKNEQANHTGRVELLNVASTEEGMEKEKRNDINYLGSDAVDPFNDDID
eukprot:14699712-Ditylum_brightwellii.AAC.1